MPVKCRTLSAKQVCRWGDRGKAYKGRGAKSRAAKQGRAIKASQHRRMKGY